MIEHILIPLIYTSLAELGDKSQISIFLLSSKTKKHLHLLFGVMLAFFIVDGVAILLGSWVTTIIPVYLLRLFSSMIFIILGAITLRYSEVQKIGKSYSQNSFFSGFILIFITEWGDKTQIATGLFSTQYNNLMVLAGTMIALTLLSIMAIYLGKFMTDKVDKRIITKIAGIIFILIGILFLIF